MNCLQHCLLQWNWYPDYKIWYNSNHAVIIEHEIDLKDKGYLPLVAFGRRHLISSFALEGDFVKILDRYFESQ